MKKYMAKTKLKVNSKTYLPGEVLALGDAQADRVADAIDDDSDIATNMIALHDHKERAVQEIILLKHRLSEACDLNEKLTDKATSLDHQLRLALDQINKFKANKGVKK